MKGVIWFTQRWIEEAMQAHPRIAHGTNPRLTLLVCQSPARATSSLRTPDHACKSGLMESTRKKRYGLSHFVDSIEEIPLWFDGLPRTSYSTVYVAPRIRTILSPCPASASGSRWSFHIDPLAPTASTS